MKTCKVVAEISVDGKVLKSKEWLAIDVMKMSITRSWLTRQFNAFLKDFNESHGLCEKNIRGRWDAYYGAPCHSHLSGSLSGHGGRCIAKFGVFE